MHRSIEHPALQPLKTSFPDIKFLVGEFRDMVTVVVPRENIRTVCQYLRDSQQFDMLFELHGVDYLNFPGAKHRFAINYGLSSTITNARLWLKVFLDPTQDTSPRSETSLVRDEDAVAKGDPGLKIDSLTSIWPGAEWMEREAYDMFGFIFLNHPDLRRILTWNGYGSFPLRKDYPLRGVGERENYKIVTRDSA
ncbi:MAG TPA: NADH-quinone oxidoreductase subunit C [Tepidisphaeraceae bacterium]|jgi:NADH-quinone oxidoreductase subunit C|nr:NADH-quinone oxidoreductase subunit C [Tepidisphaeraceae bacterium]